MEDCTLSLLSPRYVRTSLSLFLSLIIGKTLCSFKSLQQLRRCGLVVCVRESVGTRLMSADAGLGAANASSSSSSASASASGVTNATYEFTLRSSQVRQSCMARKETLPSHVALWADNLGSSKYW